MRISRTDSFKRDFRELPTAIQELFQKKLGLFMQNLRHPSLRVKKLQGFENRWEASINMFYRFTFEIHKEHYLFRRIGPHDDVLRSP
jgi:mRNA interferase RelE/StbE